MTRAHSHSSTYICILRAHTYTQTLTHAHSHPSTCTCIFQNLNHYKYYSFLTDNSVVIRSPRCNLLPIIAFALRAFLRSGTQLVWLFSPYRVVYTHLTNNNISNNCMHVVRVVGMQISINIILHIQTFLNTHTHFACMLFLICWVKN